MNERIRTIRDIISDAKRDQAGEVIDAATQGVLLPDRLQTLIRSGGSIVVDYHGNVGLSKPTPKA